MSNLERVSFAVILFLGGVALGMLYEHQRFIREVKDLREQHATVKTPPDTPSPQPEVAA